MANLPEHQRGGKHTILSKIFRKILNHVPLWSEFFNEIWQGYKAYSSLVRQYGVDTVFLAAAWWGTGDYYICCSLLPEWLKREGISQFRFMAPKGSEQKILDLYPCTRGQSVNLPDDITTFFHILRFATFLEYKGCHVYNFQQQQNFAFLGPRNLTAWDLEGFRGLTMADFYRYGGFLFSESVQRQNPEFDWDEAKLQALFSDHSLKPGKTVLLSPHSTGLEAFRPPQSFWEEIANCLKTEGYTVCTNCAGDEAPVAGTQAVFVPYSMVVPFLEKAGAFIGLRSGLCDIISTAHCKKIIIHLYQAKWWPDGNSIAYTGLNNMGLCADAVEMEYGRANPNDLKKQTQELQRRILQEFHSESIT